MRNKPDCDERGGQDERSDSSRGQRTWTLASDRRSGLERTSAAFRGVGVIRLSLECGQRVRGDRRPVLCSCLMRGERLWEAHRQHFYQQATRNGLAVLATVGRIALTDVALIALALLAAIHGGWWIAFTGLVGAATVAWTLRTFSRPRS